MAIWDNWINRIIDRRLDAKAADPMPPIFAGEKPDTGGIAGWGDWSDDQVQRHATNSAWVHSDIELIANNLSVGVLGVVEKEGEETEAIDNHEFEQLWEFPNKFMSSAWMLKYLVWWYLLRGEAYIMIVPDQAGSEVMELWPLPSNRMQPIPDAENYIRGYAYTSKKDGQPQFIAPENICYIPRPNPFNYHRGMSPITAYRLELEGDTAAAQWNRDTFNDGLTLRMLIGLRADMADRVYQKAKAELIEELVNKGRRFLIARAGDVSATNLSMTHKDAEFLSLRAFSRDIIDRVYQIPEGYWSAKANRATAEAAKASMIESAVWPLALAFSGAITRQIVMPYYGDNLRAEFEDLRPRDRMLQIAERKVYWQVKIVDEAREELGLEPLGDERGETLVSQIAKPTPPQFGGSPGGQPPPGAPQQQPPQLQDTKALSDDLRRWQGIALRRIKAGEPAAYDFESEHIPPHVSAGIKVGLSEAANEKEVKAAFAAGFRGCKGSPQAADGDPPPDWYDYP